MAYIEISSNTVNIFIWVCWMLWGSFLFLSNVDGETVAHGLLVSIGVFCLVTGTMFALFWVNGRYDLVGVKA